MEFKKSIGKGYKENDVRAFIASYEADSEQRYLELECQIEDLTKEIELLKHELASFVEYEGEFSGMETEIKEALFGIYINSTSAIFKADQDFSIQEEELNDKAQNRIIELANVQQITDQLCNEIELLTKGYDHVLKGDNVI